MAQISKYLSLVLTIHSTFWQKIINSVIDISRNPAGVLYDTSMYKYNLQKKTYLRSQSLSVNVLACKQKQIFYFINTNIEGLHGPTPL